MFHRTTVLSAMVLLGFGFGAAGRALAETAAGTPPQDLAAAAPSGDGWTGPEVFSGAALDQALAGLNDFLKDRYRVDDRMARLGDPEGSDFRATALALGEVPSLAGTARLGGFDGSIRGGASLDLHLAAFNEELQSREEPLFLRIAREASEGLAAMDDAAGLPLAADTGFFGPAVMDDVTLDDSLLALETHLFDQQVRQQALEAGIWAVSDRAVDRYVDTLRLY